MELGEISVVVAGYLFVCVKDFITTSGYKQFVENSVILLAVLLAFIVQQNVSSGQPNLFRSGDAGLWACLLLPSVANGMEMEDRSLLWTLALATFVSYVYSEGFTMSSLLWTLALATFVSYVYSEGFTMSSLLWTLALATFVSYVFSEGFTMSSLLWTLALATFVSYVYSEGFTMSRLWGVLVVVVYTCLTADLMYHKPWDAVTIAICCMIYMYVLYNISAWFKKSFTFGEASIVVQLFVCQTYRGVRNIKGSDPLEKIADIVYIGLHVAVLSLYVLSRKQCSAMLLWPVMAVIGLVYLLAVGVLYLEVTDIHSVLNNIIATDISAVLLCWWSLWLMSSVMLVCFNKQSEKLYKKLSCKHAEVSSTETLEYENVTTEQSDPDTDSEEKYKQILTLEIEQKTTNISKSKPKKGSKLREKASGSENAISVRKFFHVAMICVYVPGLMLSPSLLYLASITIAAVLIILEVIRVWKVQPFGPILDEYLAVFLDEQDTGDLILTPIYLLLGCSLPLWWNYKQQKSPCSLSMYAGLISVGVGDGAASVIGRKYGRHKWPGRKKSIEGTLAAFVSQILALQLLSFGNIPGAVISTEMIFCVALISLLEALTNQIDNLVVPMFAWVLLATIEPTY